MEAENNPELSNTILPREIYISPEQIALRALVDAMDERIAHREVTDNE